MELEQAPAGQRKPTRRILVIDALRGGRIAGAGLDVVEGEPAIPPALAVEPRIVWSPHIGGHSPDAINAMVRKVRANLDTHFAGQPVLSPIPQ